MASHCVVGLACSWIVAREKVLPAADEPTLRGALSIAAEREFASGPQDLSFDYSGTAAPGHGNVSSLLVAAPRRLLAQLEAMAKSAGLTITAITPSAAALAAATGGAVSPAGRLVLCLLPRGVELASQSPSGLHLIRHLPVRLDALGAESARLGAELRRVLALAPSESLGGPRELLVWDAVGLGRDALESLGQRIGLPLRLCGLGKDLNVTGTVASVEGGRFAQATALACRDGTVSQIDFLHSRLAPPAQGRLGRRTVWAGIAAAAVLAAGLYFLLDWRATQSQANSLRSRLAAMKASVQDANGLVSNYRFTRTWYDRRPEFLNCLKEITSAFTEDGRIWAGSLLIREDMQAVLTGKSTSDRAVQEVVDSLIRDRRLSDVKHLYTRQSGQNLQEVSFAIALTLRGAK